MPLPKNYAKHQWFIDFGGVLVSNCLAIYDNATALQEKCYAHHGVSPTKVRKVPQDFCQLPGRKGFSAIPELPRRDLV